VVTPTKTSHEAPATKVPDTGAAENAAMSAPAPGLEDHETGHHSPSQLKKGAQPMDVDLDIHKEPAAVATPEKPVATREKTVTSASASF
jgi:hypothetical protein